jgi:DNA-binding winged helix-turn-helix (wHTH) protein
VALPPRTAEPQTQTTMPGVAYQFGQFVFDLDTRQLLHEGDEIHLSPKAFDLLSVLLRNQPRAVSKAELQETLWPSTYVEETNLASLIAEIRRALGDSAASPALVRTVHRFGYRFVGELIEGRVAARTLLPAARAFLVVDNRKMMLLDGVNIIGRSPDATIQCDAPGVSRHHARILVSAGDATLEDLGSKNGTYVKGARVASVPLSDGDEIRLGRATLTFRIEQPLDPTETVIMDPEDPVSRR